MTTAGILCAVAVPIRAALVRERETARWPNPPWIELWDQGDWERIYREQFPIASYTADDQLRREGTYSCPATVLEHRR
jgi:hypothetical protein